MKKVIIAGTVLLLIQIGLVVVFNNSQSRFTPFSPNSNLLNLEHQKVDTIVITGEQEKVIHLKNLDEKWFIDEKIVVPADSNRISNLLERISTFKRGLSVGSSAEAARRFKLAPTNFKHKLTFVNQNNELGTLYLGTSPGFKQLHAKTENNENIVTVELESHEVAANSEDWIDKTILNIDAEKVQNFIFTGFNLSRQDDSEWSFEKTSSDVELSPEQVNELIQKTTSLPVYNYINKEEFSIDEISTLLVAFTTVMEDSTSLQWKFVQDGENDAIVSRSDLPYLLRIGKWLVDDIIDIVTQKKEKEQPPTLPEVVPSS